MKNEEEKVWEDIPVENWEQLQAALHSVDLIPNQGGTTGGHRRSPYMFRGMSNASWPLKTSLERLGSPPEKVEQPALRAFGKYAAIGTISIH